MKGHPKPTSPPPGNLTSFDATSFASRTQAAPRHKVDEGTTKSCSGRPNTSRASGARGAGGRLACKFKSGGLAQPVGIRMAEALGAASGLHTPQCVSWGPAERLPPGIQGEKAP